MTHRCGACGAPSLKWAGRCPSCQAWNTLVETSDPVAGGAVPVPLSAAAVKVEPVRPTGIGEVDRVLGGGLTPGSSTLLFGEPGVGKSTLALGVLRQLARCGVPVILIAVEESASQVAARARRLGPVPEHLAVVATTSVEQAERVIATYHPALCVVDSVSAMRDDSLPGATGSVTQVRQVAERLCAAAREGASALVLVGHVTKDGDLAGPRALEHLVDTVLRVEGDRVGPSRVLRALKHRFGSTGEVGLFTLGEDGMREDPEGTGAGAPPVLNVPGVVWTATLDGRRAWPVEVQALVTAAEGSPRRVAHQVSGPRLSLMLAVLEARCGAGVSGSDVFATTAGALPANEPAVDAALAVAVASARSGGRVARDVAVVGEVGLAGELRPVTGLDRRLDALRRRGVTRVLAPVGAEGLVPGVRVEGYARLDEALAALGLVGER